MKDRVVRSFKIIMNKQERVLALTARVLKINLIKLLQINLSLFDIFNLSF